MASNQHTGQNPLGIPRIDVTEKGINGAFALVSREVAERTPLESGNTGSLHTGSGVFSVPPVAKVAPRMRPAWNAVMFTNDGNTKAQFQEGWVLTDDGPIQVFTDAEDQVRTVAIGEEYYVRMRTNTDDEIVSASFGAEVDPVDVDPTVEENGSIYILVMEFFPGEVAGTFLPVYYRYDSISRVTPAAGVLNYTIYFANDSEITITEAEAVEGADGNDNWSLEFELSGTGEFTGEYVGSSSTERFPETDDVQTAYRLPIFKTRTVTPPEEEGDPFEVRTRVSSGGLYDEVKACNDGSSVTLLTKVG